jgi:hypothetical protein
MSKEITKSNGALPAAVSALANIGQNAIATAGTIGTGDAFCKFTKDGMWVYGQEEVEIEEGSTWAINPLSLRHGHIGWPADDAGGSPTEVTAPLTEPLPAHPEDESLRWGPCFSFQAVCKDGEDEGQQILVKGGSLGFNKAATGVAQAIAGQAIEGSADVVALVHFEASSYKHKKYGKINTPVLNVVGWTNMEGAAAPAVEEEPEPEPEVKKPAAPKRRRRVRKT